MRKIRPCSALAVLLATFLCSSTAFGSKAYVTDSQEVSLRGTPDSNGKVIIAVPPGSPVELINPSQWVHVRYTKPTGENRDGWAQLKFLGAWPPDSSVARELGVENETLKDKLSTMDKEKAGFVQKEKELTDKLTKLNAAYEELKGGATNYIKLKTEFDSAKASLASSQENFQTLLQENENLKLSQHIHGFAAGALVLLLGLFLGWAGGRRQKRRKSLYY